uniref:Uncharacterized protein n=1 Tax=Plectus sambesii TaxID=2011161 RepID=A0A914WPD3_9BILA
MIALIVGFLIPAALFAICGLAAWIRRCFRPKKQSDELTSIMRADQLTQQFAVCNAADGQHHHHQYIAHFGQYSDGRFHRIPPYICPAMNVPSNLDMPPSYSEATNLAGLTMSNDQQSLTSFSCTGFGTFDDAR